MERRMIQVEKRGNRYNLYRTTCPECECQFTFSSLDTKRVYMCGGMIDCRYIECPECGKEITEWKISQIDDVYNNDYRNNELHELKFKIKLHRLIKLAEEKKDKELKQMALKILKEEYGEDEESI